MLRIPIDEIEVEYDVQNTTGGDTLGGDLADLFVGQVDKCDSKTYFRDCVLITCLYDSAEEYQKHGCISMDDAQYVISCLAADNAL